MRRELTNLLFALCTLLGGKPENYKANSIKVEQYIKINDENFHSISFMIVPTFSKHRTRRMRTVN